MEDAKHVLHLMPSTYASAINFFILLSWTIKALHHPFFHPLAEFEGPKLAGVTVLYESYYEVWKNGKYSFKMDELR